LIERTPIAGRLELAHIRRRRCAHHRDEALDGVEHALHPPERQRGGTEPDDLAILVALEAAHDLNRVGNGCRVEVLVLLVQPPLQRRASVGSP
jgi:hypothetical protein